MLNSVGDIERLSPTYTDQKFEGRRKQMSISRARIKVRSNQYGDTTTENFNNETIHIRVTTPTKSSRNKRYRTQKLRIFKKGENRGLSLSGVETRSLYNVLRKHFEDSSVDFW